MSINEDAREPDRDEKVHIESGVVRTARSVRVRLAQAVLRPLPAEVDMADPDYDDKKESGD